MDAMTVQEAQADLERLIGQVVEDVDPLILGNSQGQRAGLMSLDEFRAW